MRQRRTVFRSHNTGGQQVQIVGPDEDGMYGVKIVGYLTLGELQRLHAGVEDELMLQKRNRTNDVSTTVSTD